MKQSYLATTIAILTAAILNSCATPPKFVFYHSEASIPQFAKFITSEFTLIPKTTKSLQFGVIAATDKDKSGKIVDYYLLIAPPRAYLGDYSLGVEDYIHPYHVVLRPEKATELIDHLENTIKLFKESWTSRKGMSTEYSIAKEQNITAVSKNVESWDSDFKFIYKGFNRRNEAFMNLGVVQSKENSLTYSYYLDESEVVELRDRLVDAVEELKKLGMK
ncbi:MAG: hypothetical protein U0264_01955 [Candidatus Kapaibacterium sp.]